MKLTVSDSSANISSLTYICASSWSIFLFVFTFTMKFFFQTSTSDWMNCSPFLADVFTRWGSCFKLNQTKEERGKKNNHWTILILTASCCICALWLFARYTAYRFSFAEAALGGVFIWKTSANWITSYRWKAGTSKIPGRTGHSDFSADSVDRLSLRIFIQNSFLMNVSRFHWSTW